MKTSPLFKTVELISVSSTLEGGTGGVTQSAGEERGIQPEDAPRGRILSRPTERTIREGEGKTVQKEKVQFTLEIVLDLSRGNIGTNLGK